MPNKNLCVHEDDNDGIKSTNQDSDIVIVNKIPNRRWRWVVLLAALIIRIVIGGTYATFVLFMKNFQTDLQISDSTTSWLVSIHSCLSIVVAPLATYIAHKLGHRLTVFLGLIMSGIGFGVSYFYSQLWFIVLSNSVLNAVGQCFVNTCLTIMLTDYFHDNLPLILGIYACGQGIAPLLIIPLVKQLIHSYGWHFTRLIYGSSYFICLVFALTFKPASNAIYSIFDKDKETENVSQDIKLTGIMKKKESISINEIYGSQTSKISAYMSTANIASVHMSNASVFFNNSTTSMIQSNKDLVNINVPTLMGISMASNLNMKSYMSHLSMIGATVTPLGKESKLKKKPDNENHKSLFTNWVFLLFVWANAFVSLSFDACLIYASDKAIHSGVSVMESSFVAICIGFGIIVGRLIFGFLGSCKFVNIYNVYSSCLVISGLSLLLGIVLFTYPIMLTSTVIFGIFITGYMSLNTAVLSSIVNIYHFSHCLTIIYFVQSMGVLIGLPISSYLYEFTESLNYSFLLSGSLMLFSGIILLSANCSKKFRDNQNSK